MNSLRECVSCKDIKDKTYLLPCLHPTCSQCIEDILQEARQNNRSVLGCCDCGEPFVQEMLTSVPSNNSSLKCSFECDEEATCYCAECNNKYMCKAHTDAHRVSKPTKGHVVQLVAEVPLCHKHSAETALGFCTYCKVLVCGACSITEHNQSPHLSISLELAATQMTESVKNDVAKMLESFPAVNFEIKKHQNTRGNIEKNISELNAKLEELRKQEKTETLQIEDLEKTKALVLITQTQANTLASAATTLPHPTLLRMQNIVGLRVSQLQKGLSLIPHTIFNRINSAHSAVSNNGKTMTCTNHGIWTYGISDNGCFLGVRSWRVTINVINASPCYMMFGVWNSSSNPSSTAPYGESHSWLLYSYLGSAYVYRAGAQTDLKSRSLVLVGDVILISVDCDQHHLTVRNTTQGWTYTIDQLPPGVAYYPYVLMHNMNDSVTIEEA